MRLPLRYSVRNLMRRKMRTLLTILAVGIAVGVSVGLFAFARGVLATARDSGSPDNVVIMDRKAASASFSSIRLADYNLLKSLPQVARDSSGEPMLSPEVVHQCRVQVNDSRNRAGTIRGVTQRVFDVNTRLRMIAGEAPTGGRNVAVGELAAAALRVPPENLAIGREITFEGEVWRITGRFTTGGTAMDGEIMANLGDVMAVLNRDSYSSVVARAASRSDVTPLVIALNGRNDIQFKAVPETEYYRAMSEGYQRVILLVVLVSIMATVGGLVSGLNTMYASVLGRMREIGSLKVMGFSNGAILRSIVVESLVLALVGAAAGCALAWPVDGMGARFTSSALRVTVDAWAIGGGVLIAVVIGVTGALIPSITGLRSTITSALNAN
jgi:putative ABC transport system permease protein